MIHRGSKAQTYWQIATWLLVVLSLWVGIPVLAQSSRGTLSGSVKDAKGAFIPGAGVSLKETNTGSNYTAKATAEGLFSFSELPPGSYTLTVTAPGFESYTQSGIAVDVGGTSTVNAALKVGAESASVSVNSDASHLETESSDVGFTMSPQLLDALPLPFGGEIRNPLDFAALAPGFAGTMSNNPSSPPSGNFKLSGGQQGRRRHPARRCND